MKNWLAKIKPPKYLRYFFYIAYRWYTGYESERYTAHITAALFLAFAHTFIVFWLILIIAAKEFFVNTNKYTGVIPIIVFLAVTHYFLFLYKNKWKKYAQEFKHLTKVQRRKGTYLLIFYLVFSIALAASPIYFGEMEHNKIAREKAAKESIRVYDTYSIAKCILVDKNNSEDFVFYEFYLEGQKIKGATAIAKGSGAGLEGAYFKVNYSSRNNRENVLLVNAPITDISKIKAAGF